MEGSQDRRTGAVTPIVAVCGVGCDLSRVPAYLHSRAFFPPTSQVRLNHLIFEQGQSTIEPQSFPELDEIALMMQENSKIEIQLEGHTDNVGSPDANLKLSQQRVDAVKNYIVKKGVKKSRVKTKAFGGSKPLRNEMTPEARAHNRRVEMRILKD